MILSDTDIHNAIGAGQIGIEPFDHTRLNPASYTLSLGSRLLIPRPSEIIDPEATSIVYDEVEISENGHTVRPGDFLLGSVAESISIFTSHAARLDARTSLVRLGLNVLQGSTHIEPGQHSSHETLEITNVGPSPVLLRVGMKIVKIVFELLETPASRVYSGPYAGQKDGRAQ